MAKNGKKSAITVTVLPETEKRFITIGLYYGLSSKSDCYEKLINDRFEALLRSNKPEIEALIKIAEKQLK